MDNEWLAIGIVTGSVLLYASYRYFKKYKFTHLSGLAKRLKSEKIPENNDYGRMTPISSWRVDRKFEYK